MVVVAGVGVGVARAAATRGDVLATLTPLRDGEMPDTDAARRGGVGALPTPTPIPAAAPAPAPVAELAVVGLGEGARAPAAVGKAEDCAEGREGMRRRASAQVRWLRAARVRSSAVKRTGPEALVVEEMDLLGVAPRGGWDCCCWG